MSDESTDNRPLPITAINLPERGGGGKFLKRAPVRAESMKLLVQKLPHYLAPTPLPDLAYQTDGSSGFDIYAAIGADLCLATIGDREMIPTGFCVQVPLGYELQIRPRSGLAAKYGISVLNTPGTVDSDYRGEIKIILVNLSTKRFWVRRGDRIAQAVLAAVPKATIEYSDSLDSTDRGAGGFGSTGV